MQFRADRARITVLGLLAGLLALSLAARLHGIAWDGYAALHPDERHLFLVTRQIFDALRDPANAGLGWADWWLSDRSPLNPHLGERSYVYGEAPLFAGALLGWVTGATDWFAFIPVARVASAVVDTATVLAVFLGARLVSTDRTALVAATLYAVMPTALQLANFHTVDVWLSFATAATLVPLIALVTGRTGRVPAVALWAVAGAFLGLAVACKVTGVLLGLPALLALGLAHRRHRDWRQSGAALAALGLAALGAFRVLDPFAFAGTAWLGLAPSGDWIADFRQLAAVTASPDFPPNWQWMAGYGALALARDSLLFGCGPVALLVLAGLRRRDLGGPALILIATIAAFVLLMGLSSVSALRYGAPALAALAMLAAPVTPRLGRAGTLAVIVAAVWWGSGTLRLHDGAHPRIEASLWLWQRPPGTVLTNETAWDDTLPTLVRLTPEGPFLWPTQDDRFRFLDLDITAPDSAEKADRIATLLGETGLLILSSDRQSAVMPRLPRRFPMTAAHYAALDQGLACFAPAFERRRGYPLPLMPFDDSWAQEPWRVYDHPVVRIFRRQPCYQTEVYRAFLMRFVPQ